jgi:hypothetical protein
VKVGRLAGDSSVSVAGSVSAVGDSVGVWVACGDRAEVAGGGLGVSAPPTGALQARAIIANKPINQTIRFIEDTFLANATIVASRPKLLQIILLIQCQLLYYLHPTAHPSPTVYD